MKPVFTEVPLPEKFDITYGDVLKIAGIELTEINNDEIPVKHSLNKFDNQCYHFSIKDRNKYYDNIPKTIYDFFNELRNYYILLYNEKQIPVGGASKTEEDIIKSLSKFDMLPIKNIAYKHEKGILLDNFNKFGNSVNHWFPEMLDTGITSQGKKSIIGALNDEKFCIRNLVQLLLFDRLHRFSTMLKVDDDITVYTDKKYLNTKIKHELRQMFRIGFHIQSVTNFPPIYSKYIWTATAKKYFPKEKDLIFYDSSFGWGGRMIGAFSCSKFLRNKHITLYGTDPNTDVHDRFQGIHDYWKEHINPKLNVKVDKDIVGSEFIHETKKYNKYKGKVHVSLTSPPYFNRELYGSENQQQSHILYKTYDEWVEGFLKPTIKNTYDLMVKGGISYINVANIRMGTNRYLLLEDDTIRIAKECGYELENTLYMKFSTTLGNNKNKEHTYEVSNVNVNNMIDIDGTYWKTEPIFKFRKK